MSYPKTALRLAIFPLVLTAASFLGVGQEPRQSQDPQDKPRKVKPEPDRAFKDWVTKDVTYIITDWERKAYDKLTSNEERERFIEEFWRRRDRDPDTDENEFKEEYNERIAYANEHFASGIPGWKTDRGRIWIMYGKPDARETHPMGGSYDRPSYEGGGSTTTYPFETWSYRYLPGVGSGIDIEFVDPTGSGEYRIARNANEKDAMLMVPGAGLTLSEQLGLSDKSDRITGTNSNGSMGYQREQDSPFSRLLLMKDLLHPPQVKFNDLQPLIGTPVIDDNPLSFDLRIDFFRLTDERVITAFTIQTENRDLSFQESGG
jgi:GWxTD domain-containing protein